MTGPERTCIGCRGRAAKSDLVRLVWRDSAVVVDARQIATGRGAYLHPEQACLDRAIRKRAVGRALRVTGAATGLESVQVALAGRRLGESGPGA